MGFVLLGIATLTPVGINGALFGNVAHGLITGLLFFLAGGDQGPAPHRRPRRRSARACYERAPRLGGLLAFAAIASLGLPGLAGFWGEMLALLGAFRPAAGPRPRLFLVLMAVAGVGVVLDRRCTSSASLRRVAQGVSRAALASSRCPLLDAAARAARLVAGGRSACSCSGLWPRAACSPSRRRPYTALLGGERDVVQSVDYARDRAAAGRRT